MSYCLIYILCSTFWNAFVEKSCSKLFADPPSALRVVNITHRSVQLEWQPGFHGGMDQYFRLEYNSNGKSQVRFFFQIIIKLSQSKKRGWILEWLSGFYPLYIPSKVRKLKSFEFHWLHLSSLFLLKMMSFSINVSCLLTWSSNLFQNHEISIFIKKFSLFYLVK